MRTRMARSLLVISAATAFEAALRPDISRRALSATRSSSSSRLSMSLRTERGPQKSLVVSWTPRCTTTSTTMRRRPTPRAFTSTRTAATTETSAAELPEVTQTPKKQQKQKQQQQKKTSSPPKKQEDGDAKKKITPACEDFSQWYQDVIAAADLVDQSPVKGCMVLKPLAMSLWEALRSDLDARIVKTGAENAYFPLLIPRSFLSREADHVDGFAKECAVVTHHRLLATDSGVVPDPSAELEEPLVVRPTSETIVWHMFGKWINSYRDLPLKINQWANVVRWEMRTRPFLRSAEFLWQEGHTAHETKEEAVETAREMLDAYADACQSLLAIPVVKGAKSPTERFAGADETLTIEALMPNGWALQSGTSHFLGQNFAKAFDVDFQTKDATREFVWATSWGASTRLLGALVMTHSDDDGLVLPPRVAPVQIVVVPVGATSKKPEDKKKVDDAVDALVTKLKAAHIRVKVDDRDHLRPGPKFFEWERKGVPLRIELGPRDVAAQKFVLASRFQIFPSKENDQQDDDDDAPKPPPEEKISTQTNVPKETWSLDDPALADELAARLDAMQAALLARATDRLTRRTQRVASYNDMRAALLDEDGDDDDDDDDDERAADDEKVTAASSSSSTSLDDRPGFFLAPWRDDAENEAAIKADCKATIRCFPDDHQHEIADAPEPLACFYSGEPATHMALFARAF